MKKQLILVMMLISLLPLLAFAAYSLPTTNGKLQSDAYTINEKSAEQAQEKVTSLVRQKAELLRVLAENNNLKEYQPGKQPEVKNLLIAAGKVNPELQSLVFSAPDGQQLVKNTNTELGNNKDRDYFKQVLQKGDLVVSDVVISTTTKKQSINIVLPVRGASGEIVGVVQCTMTLDMLSQFAKDFSVDGGTAFIADRSGKILAHPNAEMLQKDIKDTAYFQHGSQGGKATEQYTNESGSVMAVSYKQDPLTGWVVFSEKNYDTVMAEGTQLIHNGILLLVLALLLAGAAGWFYSGRITKPIVQLVGITQAVAQGDLTVNVNVKAKHEIGMLADSLNQMTCDLRSLITGVKDTSILLATSSEELHASADQTSTATEHVASSVQQMAEDSDKQSRRVEGTAKTVNEMVDGVKQIALSAQTVTSSAVLATDKAAEGDQSIQTAVKEINRLRTVFDELTASVSSLGSHSQLIGNIVNVIAGISAQTNMLSLNAGIEAARAGEHGKGFAVVASEVKKLADQSSASARQISDLVKSIQEEIGQVIQKTELGSREVVEGIQAVHHAGESFEEISNLVAEVSRQIQEVSVSSTQLFQGASEVMTAMDDMASIAGKSASETQSVSAATEQQLATMEEIASSSELLSNMAQDLQSRVDRFKV
ncbi:MULTISPECIES: methyl-accepting chemotaxis protein [Paenibacillus]|uniref:methyl-accepting chemotaxis protein n=1 Tax=Paenibacillus TaxID=44249 RepID=UPI0022B8632D|nr:methyl-accepting chemotaxis protein [Paenibacillus caseinilyticus]MCZ8519261.1 methyl-accepting chemotaxis protein [Paenibacillus caseinilyticus]